MAYKYEEKLVSLLDRLDAEERNYTFAGIDDELKDVYAKAKAFDEIVEVFKDYPLKTDSDVMDFIQAKLDDMEDK